MVAIVAAMICAIVGWVTGGYVASQMSPRPPPDGVALIGIIFGAIGLAVSLAIGLAIRAVGYFGFRYRLRTLVLLTIVGPPALAGAWFIGTDAVGCVLVFGVIPAFAFVVACGIVWVADAAATFASKALNRR